MSRRRAANRREWFLPVPMPDRYPTGIAFDPCVPAGLTETIHCKTPEPREASTRRTNHCRPAKQTIQRIEDLTDALIAGNHRLAQLVFQWIRPRTQRGATSVQAGSPDEPQRTRPTITPPDIANSLTHCREVPAQEPIAPEVETLFTELARRRLRKRPREETQ
jgi:hypothetical protein